MNYHKSKFRSSKGFTLIEILTVIAIIAILSAILVPTVSQMQTTARKTKDLSNMRQIINASQQFATQNGDLMPQTGHFIGADGFLKYTPGADNITNIGEAIAILAVEVGLNDLNIWLSDSDPGAMVLNGPTPALVNGVMNPILANTNPGVVTDPVSPGYISFNYVVGLTLGTPSQTPIVFSRLDTPSDAAWSEQDMYNGEGGHIGFAGGNVSWFEGAEPFKKLYKPDGTTAASMLEAIQATDSEGVVLATTPVIATN